MSAGFLPWPELPDVVAKQLEIIAAEGGEDEDPVPEAVDPVTGEVLPRHVRPWELSALSGELEAAVLDWLDDVVLWLNAAYGWQDDHVIPACWQLHQGLAHDLAAVAFGRIDAYDTATAAFVGRWHSDLEYFQRRMALALAKTGNDCRLGDHTVPTRYTLDGVRIAINRRKAGPAREA